MDKFMNINMNTYNIYLYSYIGEFTTFIYKERFEMLEKKWEKHGSTVVDTSLIWLWWVMHTDLEKVGYSYT
jgi:hypothetical protein